MTSAFSVPLMMNVAREVMRGMSARYSSASLIRRSADLRRPMTRSGAA